jgi:hypothetical protein
MALTFPEKKIVHSVCWKKLKQNTLAYISDKDSNAEIERKERVMTVKKESNASIKEHIVRRQWLSQKKIVHSVCCKNKTH